MLTPVPPEPAPPPTTPADHAVHGRSVLTVSGFTLASRVMGLARDAVTARIFGDTAVGSAFAAAFAIPNLFRRLFGEGALSAAFLPEYTRLSDTDRPTAGAFASLTMLLLALVTGAITAIVELALLGVLLLAPADPDRTLSLGLVMVMLPYMPLVCVAAILGGMLQAHGRFGPWAAAPMLLNAAILGASVPYFLSGGGEAAKWAYIIGVAAVVSGVLQVAWSAAMLRGRVAWTTGFAAARAQTRAMLLRMGPVVLGLGTLQVNSLMDTLIAMWPNWVGPTIAGRPYPLDEASNSVLFYAQRLYQFPLGVFAIAVATVAFPALSRAAGDGAAFAGVLARGVRLSLFIAVPASVGLVLVRDDLVAVIYTGGGGFSQDGAARASAVLLGYGWAVWAYSINQVLTRGFYAAGDTTSPMRIALAMVGLNVLLNVILIWPLGEAGLAWSTATAATVQGALLWGLARRRLARRGILSRADAVAVGRTVAVSVLMGGCVLAVVLLWPDRDGWADHLWALTAACGCGMGVFGVGSLLARSPELGWLLARRA